jgi:hypothetical protein
MGQISMEANVGIATVVPKPTIDVSAEIDWCASYWPYLAPRGPLILFDLPGKRETAGCFVSNALTPAPSSKRSKAPKNWPG